MLKMWRLNKRKKHHHSWGVQSPFMNYVLAGPLCKFWNAFSCISKFEIAHLYRILRQIHQIFTILPKYIPATRTLVRLAHYAKQTHYDWVGKTPHSSDMYWFSHNTNLFKLCHVHTPSRELQRFTAIYKTISVKFFHLPATQLGRSDWWLFRSPHSWLGTRRFATSSALTETFVRSSTECGNWFTRWRKLFCLRANHMQEKHVW